MEDLDTAIEELTAAKQHVLAKEYPEAKEILLKYITAPGMREALQTIDSFKEYVAKKLAADQREDLVTLAQVSMGHAYVAMYPTIPEGLAVASAHNGIAIAIALLEIAAGRREFR